MSGTTETPKEQTIPAKVGRYLRKNWFSTLLILFAGILLISPDAKSFVLRQLMLTGLFNAGIDDATKDTRTAGSVDFNFSDDSGNVQHTAALRGKVVFINFWASWCPPCRAEFPSIEKLYTAFKDHPDVFFLTINEDSDISKGKAYLQKEGYTVPFYTAGGSIPEEIYNGTLPTTIILDKNGQIRFHHTGFANYAAEKFIAQLQQLAAE